MRTVDEGADARKSDGQGDGLLGKTGVEKSYVVSGGVCGAIEESSVVRLGAEDSDPHPVE